MSPATLLAVAFGGAVGAVGRYVLVLLLRPWLGATAWPIAIVNVVGCFGFGLCWVLAQGRWSPRVAAAVLAGFFGAFTTFSTFAFDCQELLQERRYAAMLGNAVGQNLAGIAALWFGALAGSALRS